MVATTAEMPTIKGTITPIGSVAVHITRVSDQKGFVRALCRALMETATRASYLLQFFAIFWRLRASHARRWGRHDLVGAKTGFLATSLFVAFITPIFDAIFRWIEVCSCRARSIEMIFAITLATFPGFLAPILSPVNAAMPVVAVANFQPYWTRAFKIRMALGDAATVFKCFMFACGFEHCVVAVWTPKLRGSALSIWFVIAFFSTALVSCGIVPVACPLAKFSFLIIRNFFLALRAFTVVGPAVMLGIDAAFIWTFTIVSATVMKCMLERVD